MSSYASAFYRKQDIARTIVYGPPAKLTNGANPLYPPGVRQPIWRDNDLLSDDSIVRWQAGVARADREYSDMVRTVLDWQKVERQKQIAWGRSLLPVTTPWRV